MREGAHTFRDIIFAEDIQMREIAVVLVAAFSALVSGPTCALASSLPLASDVPVIEHAEIILGPRGPRIGLF